jgi:hypothetical protein
LKRHAETPWACDFFFGKVWTPGGLVDLFVLFFLRVGEGSVPPGPPADPRTHRPHRHRAGEGEEGAAAPPVRRPDGGVNTHNATNRVATVNVGSDGAAVDHANNTTMTLLDNLLAADGHATHSSTAAGFVLYAGDQGTRNLADDLFGRLNDTGGL